MCKQLAFIESQQNVYNIMHVHHCNIVMHNRAGGSGRAGGAMALPLFGPMMIVFIGHTH